MDHDTLDLRPATTALARVLAGIGDDQLPGRTPCPSYSVLGLVGHVRGLTHAFTLAARKEPVPGGPAAPSPGVTPPPLPDGWREETAAALDALAAAWSDPASYDGLTMAGPVELPAPQAALVALDEVVVHGWDLAVATGQEYDADPAAVAACAGFVASFEPPAGGPGDTPVDDGGLFGPPVPVPADAPALDRLIGATGRNPAWRP